MTGGLGVRGVRAPGRAIPGVTKVMCVRREGWLTVNEGEHWGGQSPGQTAELAEEEEVKASPLAFRNSGGASSKRELDRGCVAP